MPTDLADLAGVVTWFEGPLRAPLSTARWLAALEQACGTTIPRAVLGDPGTGTGPLVAQAGLGDAIGVYLHDGSTRPVWRNWSAPKSLVIPPGLFTAYPAQSGATAEITLPLAEGALTLLRADPDKRELFIHSAFLAQLDDPGAVVAKILRPSPLPLPDLVTEGALRIATITLDAEGWDLHAQTRTGTTLGPTAGEFAEALLAQYPDLAVTIAAPENVIAESGARLAALAEHTNITLVPATRRDGMLDLALTGGSVVLAPAQVPAAALALPYDVAGIPLLAPLRGESLWADPTGLHGLLANPLPDMPLHLRLAAADLLNFGGRAAMLKTLERLDQPDIRVLDMSSFRAKRIGADQLRIGRVGPNRFEIRNRGALHGLRLALAAGSGLDAAASDGIADVVSTQNGLRIALDPDHRQPVIALTACAKGQEAGC